MNPKNRATLAERVARAAEAALAGQHFVSAIDVFVGIGWLDPGTVKRWRSGQVDCLESEVRSNPRRQSEAMRLFRCWAVARQLSASEAAYLARTPQHRTLRFSRSGNSAIEQAYRTHWISPEVSGSRRERLEEKASRAPELVVIQPLKPDWKCHRCGGTGSLLVMENPGPACLACLGLGDLEFLPAGDAMLTRRAKKMSSRHAVVVRFSRARRRYERQGLLVEPRALAEARS